MKGFKKLFTVFLALVITVIGLPLADVTVSALYTDTFDFNAAIDYAKIWAKDRNPNYFDFSNAAKTSGDCCNFVFQVLTNSGIPETQYFHGSQAYCNGNKNNVTASANNVPSLIQYFRSMYGIKYYNNTGKLGIGTISEYDYINENLRQNNNADITNYDGQTVNACDGHDFTINDIESGDCVTINGNYGRNHIVFVLSVDYANNSMQIAAHTSDRYNYTYYTYGNYSVKGVLKTSDLIGTSTPTSDETGFVYGDINGDGKMTITDNVQINNNVVEKVANGEVPITDINARAADVDLDNAITKTDSELLKKALVGLVDLPVVGDYKCYIISPAISSTYTMDVKGGRNSDCTNIGAYGRHGANNQQFMVVPVYSAYTGSRKLYNRIIPLSDSSYTKCLNIDEANDNNLILYTFSGTINELWTFEPVKGAFNQYYIKSALGGALAVEGDYDGANIYLDDYNMFDNNQKWVLTEVANPKSGSSVSEQLEDVQREEIKPTTPDNLSFSDNGIQLLCSYEDFAEECDWDAAQYSIGYGTKCTGNHPGKHYITQEEALAVMKAQVEAKYAPNVRRQTANIKMNQNQFDALVSLCYNTGGGNSIISSSPLVRYLRGELTEEQARSQYSQYYIKSEGAKNPGLVNRRNKEADLFFSAVDNISVSKPTNDPAPSQVNSNLIDMQLVSTHIDNLSYISYYNSYNTKEVVMALQRLLNEYGNYGLAVDGICGNATRNAIRSFQRDNGLTVDGLFGVASKNKLREKLDL